MNVVGEDRVMKGRKIVVDSSANLLGDGSEQFASVPLKILAGGVEYVDDETLDVAAMMDALEKEKGPSSTACPSVGDWLQAFGDAQEVFGVAISSQMSGSYNAGKVAAEQYGEEHTDRQAFLLDSLSAGPGVALMVEECKRLTASDRSFQEVCRDMKAYAARVRLVFSLESLSNFAKNGRVPAALAKLASFLGIRVVCRASEKGEFQLLHKCRGERSAIQKLLEQMDKEGFAGGRVRIHHTQNPAAAQAIRDRILADYPGCDVTIEENRGLCSYYAERGGFLVGFEDARK